MSSDLEFNDDLTLDTGDPIGIDFMRNLFLNENFLDQTKLEGDLRNIRGPISKSGRNKSRDAPAPKYIEKNMLLYSVSEDFGFGASAPLLQGGKTAYRRVKSQGTEYRWPTNANGSIFSSEYQPVVIVSLINNPGVQYPAMFVTLTRITPKWVEFWLSKSDLDSVDPKPAGTDRFWVSIMALGVKGPYFD